MSNFKSKAKVLKQTTKNKIFTTDNRHCDSYKNMNSFSVIESTSNGTFCVLYRTRVIWVTNQRRWRMKFIKWRVAASEFLGILLHIYLQKVTSDPRIEESIHWQQNQSTVEIQNNSRRSWNENHFLLNNKWRVNAGLTTIFILLFRGTNTILLQFPTGRKTTNWNKNIEE